MKYYFINQYYELISRTVKVLNVIDNYLNILWEINIKLLVEMK